MLRGPNVLWRSISWSMCYVIGEVVYPRVSRQTETIHGDNGEANLDKVYIIGVLIVLYLSMMYQEYKLYT